MCAPMGGDVSAPATEHVELMKKEAPQLVQLLSMPAAGPRRAASGSAQRALHLGKQARAHVLD